MTTHYLHLHPEPFQSVKDGTKTVESRLFDEKRQKYTIGDRLVFLNRSNDQETTEVEIVGLHRATTFQELFAQKNVKGKFSTDSIDELLHSISQYYSNEEQKKYGVIGVGFIKLR